MKSRSGYRWGVGAVIAVGVLSAAPAVQAVVGWRSPVTGPMRVEATVTHAHLACGDGVSWTLELRHGAIRRRLATGTAVSAEPAGLIIRLRWLLGHEHAVR